MRRFLLLPLLLLLFAGPFASPAFGQDVQLCSPDVNLDNAVDGDDALALYYAYSLSRVLGTGRGDVSGGGAAREISIAAVAPTVAEESPAVFMLTASEAAQTGFTVNVEVSATGDFGVATGTRTVEFAGNEATATLNVDTAGDDAIETWGTVTAMLRCGTSGYAIGRSDTASVAVADDDVKVSIAASSSPVVENSPAVFVLTASGAPLTAFTVEVDVSVSGAFDVTTGPRSAVFDVGDTSYTLSVDTRGDAVDEPNGMVTATVPSGFGYALGEPSMASVTVTDDDLGISIAASSSLVVEGSPAAFILTASEEPAVAFTVRVEVSVMGDFGVSPGPREVEFEVSQLTATLSIDTKNDTDVEDAGSVTATVQDGVGYVVGMPRTAEVVIADGEPLMVGGSFRDCAACPEMVVVASSTFTMGSPTSDRSGGSKERPRHEVTIPNWFAVGRYEVTFAEWNECVEDRGCGNYTPSDSGWGRETRPVINVHWDDAKRYVAWLSEETGETYRLLTESEWEYAARAGTDTAWHWGDTVVRGNANCTVCGATGDENAGSRTAPVGSYPANQFGLHDMSGNAAEWVEDCWHTSYHGAPADGTAWVDDTVSGGNCGSRVVRGGSWQNGSGDVRSADRVGWGSGTSRLSIIGFRVARELD